MLKDPQDYAHEIILASGGDKMKAIQIVLDAEACSSTITPVWALTVIRLLMQL